MQDNRKLNNKYRFAAAAVVSVITFLVYLPCLHNGFVNWDDNVYVTDNPHIRRLAPAFFKWAFSSFYGSNWHPLTWISHVLDYSVWGLNPFGHHLTNILLHAVNTFLAAVLAMGLLEAWKTVNNGESGERCSFLTERTVLITGGVTGLLFGLHPLHVESVAWISERKDLLCVLFFLLSIMKYMEYESNPRFLNKQYLFSLGFFILALLSKPMAVSLPGVLLILDWYPFQRIGSVKSFLSAAIEKTPFILLSLGSSILTILAQQSAIQSMNVAPLSSRLVVAAQSLLTYLWKMALPLRLVPFYPYPKHTSMFSPEYLVPVMLVPVITVACLVMARKHKSVLSVWGYYVFTLIPVLGIVQVGGQSMADRYTYLPSLGPFLIAGLLAGWSWARINTLQRWAKIGKIIGLSAGIVAIVALSVLTFEQIRIWKDGFTLWTYVIEKEPKQVPVAYNNLGNVYQTLNMPDKAMGQYLIAINLKPDYVDAHYNLAVIYQDRNMPEKAIREYMTVIELRADYVDAHYNLGNAYYALNMREKAMEEYTIAIRLKPEFVEAHGNLGIIFQDLNMLNRAIEQYLIVINLKPGLALSHYNLGVIYQARNMLDRAIEQYLIAINLKPEFEEAHCNLGLAYLNSGQIEKARGELITAVKLKPEDQLAQRLLKEVSHRMSSYPRTILGKR